MTLTASIDRVYYFFHDIDERENETKNHNEMEKETKNANLFKSISSGTAKIIDVLTKFVKVNYLQHDPLITKNIN